jgi:hypothetical protein
LAQHCAEIGLERRVGERDGCQLPKAQMTLAAALAQNYFGYVTSIRVFERDFSMLQLTCQFESLGRGAS